MDNKYTYISSLIHPITNPCHRAVLIKDLLNGRPRSYLASPNAVVLDEEQGKLFTWTGERWDDFYPDQFTDYDGLNPYKKKKFHYIGLTPYIPYDDNSTVKLMPAGMAGVIACSKDELTTYNASVLDVVQHCGRLYTFTAQKHWIQFVPGPCDNYDGPNPYEKKVWISSAPLIDTPFAKMIREQADALKNLVQTNHIKHIGETITDIVDKPKKRSVEIRYTDHRDAYFLVHYALIGDVVTYNGAEYIYTGENNGWEVFSEPFQPNNKEEKNMAKHNIFENEELCLTYIGKTTTSICENSTTARLYVEGCWISSKAGYMVMFDGRLYVCAPDGKWHDLTATNVKTTNTTPTNYSKIPYGYLFIKKVVFSDPATIVLWKDGSKTIVKCGENESFDPEKGLAMAIAKKAFGNQGNYYNQIKKWLPKPEEDDDEALTITERLNKIFGDPRIADAKKKLAAVQELICDMTFHGATKAELVRAIRFSKDLIDFSKGADIDITESVSKNGIIELEAKYQPK